MHPKLFHVLCTLGCFASSLALFAETQTPAPRASVTEVNDNRSTGMSQSGCKLDLLFTGDIASDAQAVRSIKITRAVDDKGRDLSQKGTNAGADKIDLERHGTTLKSHVTIRNPSRGAATIKLLEGEATFYFPETSNGGIVAVPNFLRNAGEPLQNETLKRNKVTLSYVTKEAYAAKKKELEEKQQKDVPAEAGALLSAFRTMLGGTAPSDSKNSVSIVVDDPEKKVAEIIIADAAGNPLPRRGWRSMGPIWQWSFESQPPADAQLIVYVTTPESMKTYPFSIENIPLP